MAILSNHVVGAASGFSVADTSNDDLNSHSRIYAFSFHLERHTDQQYEKICCILGQTKWRPKLESM